MATDEKTLAELSEKIDRIVDAARPRPFLNMATDEQNERLKFIEEKLDRVLEMAPIIDALGRILIRRKTANIRAEIDPTTLSKNDKITKFEEVGHKRVFIEVGDISVVKKRQRRK